MAAMTRRWLVALLVLVVSAVGAGPVAASPSVDPTASCGDGATAVQEQTGGSPSSNQLLGGLDQTIRRVDGSGSRELLTDALGSTVGLVDGSGVITTSYTYEPYGATTTSGSASANPSQFTGREADASGLYYYRARYYSPSLGRFISEDPAGFAAGDPNLYRYVGGDPLNATDPSGLFVFVPCVAGAAIDVAITVADNWLSGRKTTLGDIAGSAVSGCVAGYVGAGLGKALKWLGERAMRWLGKGDDLIRWVDDAAEAACSFPADTAVATPDGSEPIGEVDVGDTVLAYDPATGETEERAVTATSVHRDSEITRVLVDGETVVTTPDHPFLTAGRGWVAAGDLRPGDELVSATGPSGAVFAVTTRHGSADMWDLTVAPTHTFSVGAGGWVVHNCAAPRGFPGDTLVSDILKTKQARILRAKMPKGSPSWDQVRNMTWDEIVSKTKQGERGYKTIHKLLTDLRFDR